jgi:hypothetical protein
MIKLDFDRKKGIYVDKDGKPVQVQPSHHPASIDFTVPVLENAPTDEEIEKMATEHAINLGLAMDESIEAFCLGAYIAPRTTWVNNTATVFVPVQYFRLVRH